MVTEVKVFSSPWARYRLGSVLIWLGVLAWAPYIFLRVTGISTSPFYEVPIPHGRMSVNASHQSLQQGESAKTKMAMY